MRLQSTFGGGVAASGLSESASGLIDSVNTDFASSIPFRPETLEVTLNGLVQINSISYSILNPTTIRFVNAPTQDLIGGDDEIILRYYPVV